MLQNSFTLVMLSLKASLQNAFTLVMLSLKASLLLYQYLLLDTIIGFYNSIDSAVNIPMTLSVIWLFRFFLDV